MSSILVIAPYFSGLVFFRAFFSSLVFMSFFRYSEDRSCYSFFLSLAVLSFLLSITSLSGELMDFTVWVPFSISVVSMASPSFIGTSTTTVESLSKLMLSRSGMTI